MGAGQGNLWLVAGNQSGEHAGSWAIRHEKPSRTDRVGINLRHVVLPPKSAFFLLLFESQSQQ